MIYTNNFLADAESSRRTKELAFHEIERDYNVVHNHDYWEFFVILDGSMKHTINGESLEMNQFDACLIKPSDCHALKKSTKTTKHLNIMINCGAMKRIADSYWDELYDKLLSFPRGISISLSSLEYDHIAHYLSIIKSDVSAIASEKQVPEKFLLSFILENVARKLLLTDNSYPDWLNRVILFMNDSINMAANVDSVVKLSNYSYSHLSRLFHQYIGESLSSYLLGIKLRNASELLIHSSKSVLGISYDLGFSSVSHFIKIFKNKYCVTPAKYRKLHTK